MDVSLTYLRFLFASCVIGVSIGVTGCATNSWSQSLSGNQRSNVGSQMSSDETSTTVGEQEKATVKAPKPFWHQGFGEMSGIDPRSREIERSLGF